MSDRSSGFEPRTDSARAPLRRTLLTTAWAAPVAVVATATPAVAASPDCPAIQPHSSAFSRMEFSNVWNGRWQRGTSLSVVVEMGAPEYAAPPNGWAGVAFSSDTAGVETTLTSFSRTITVDFRLRFSSVSGWSIAEAPVGGGRWSYVFTYQGSSRTRSAVTPLRTVPPPPASTNTFPRQSFPVTYVSGFTEGQSVTGPFNFDVRDVFDWTSSTGRASCDESHRTDRGFTYSIRPTFRQWGGRSAGEEVREDDSAVGFGIGAIEVPALEG